jgi:hypothetical protein
MRFLKKNHVTSPKDFQPSDVDQHTEQYKESRHVTKIFSTHVRPNNLVHWLHRKASSVDGTKIFFKLKRRLKNYSVQMKRLLNQYV